MAPITDHKGKNSLFIELFGNAPTVSLNFERNIFVYNYVSIYGRSGVGIKVIDFSKNDLVVPSLPKEITAPIGRKKHKVEFGVGITPFYSKNETWPHNNQSRHRYQNI